MSDYRKYLINTLVLYSCDKSVIAEFTAMCKQYTDSDEWDDTLCIIARACQAEEITRRTRYNEKV